MMKFIKKIFVITLILYIIILIFTNNYVTEINKKNSNLLTSVFCVKETKYYDYKNNTVICATTKKIIFEKLNYIKNNKQVKIIYVYEAY